MKIKQFREVTEIIDIEDGKKGLGHAPVGPKRVILTALPLELHLFAVRKRKMKNF